LNKKGCWQPGLSSVLRHHFQEIRYQEIATKKAVKSPKITLIGSTKTKEDV
jgi:hypothetical protein